ncbi:MAG TPA: OmpA family protein [Enhygromyxa sp.]|nr:OmpA family protein [Enhygromyxa sp.]
MSTQSRTLQLVGIVTLASMVACASARERRQSSETTQSDYRGDEVEPGQLGASQRSRARGYPPIGVDAQPSLDQGDPPEWRITAVVIDVGVADLCRIDAAQANFQYDSAQLDADAQATIAALADCFVNGPLAGRELVVIGHTDPRGLDDYNRELGMSRAEAVAEALNREGLTTTRIDVESHGEAEAHTDPAEWPDDRRVDIEVSG